MIEESCFVSTLDVKAIVGKRCFELINELGNAIRAGTHQSKWRYRGKERRLRIALKLFNRLNKGELPTNHEVAAYFGKGARVNPNLKTNFATSKCRKCFTYHHLRDININGDCIHCRGGR